MARAAAAQSVVAAQVTAAAVARTAAAGAALACDSGLGPPGAHGCDSSGNGGSGGGSGGNDGSGGGGVGGSGAGGSGLGGGPKFGRRLGRQRLGGQARVVKLGAQIGGGGLGSALPEAEPRHEMDAAVGGGDAGSSACMMRVCGAAGRAAGAGRRAAGVRRLPVLWPRGGRVPGEQFFLIAEMESSWPGLLAGERIFKIV